MKNNTAIYCRLSVDDKDNNESNSIINQKNILIKYCKEHKFNIHKIYIDDGYSGTNFNRPGYIEMKNDIELGLINVVITKDLSRLGRDYIEVGRLIERYFPENNIRYIALSDNIDTIDDIDDYIPFKNIINEFYAKDISKKIRTIQKYQNEIGIYKKTKTTLYGYKDLNNEKRIINIETSPNVKLIYDLFIKGYSLKGITDYLYQNKILTPSSYKNNTNNYKWNPKQIKEILTNPEYMGYYIKGKTTSRFKNKKRIKVNMENRYIFKSKFEGIITKETFDLAQLMFSKAKQNSSIYNPYSGIIYCEICGKPLRLQRHRDGKNHYEERLVCSNTNEKGKGSILINDLNIYVKNELLKLKRIINIYKLDYENKELLNNFIKAIINLNNDNYNTAIILRNIISKIIISTYKNENNKNKLGKKIIINYKILDSYLKNIMEKNNEATR